MRVQVFIPYVLAFIVLYLFQGANLLTLGAFLVIPG